MKKRIAVLMIALSLTLAFGGCFGKNSGDRGETETHSPMSEFYFSDAFRSYQVTFSETATLTLHVCNQTHLPFHEEPKYYKTTVEIDEDTASKIAALYEKHNLSKWNGFYQKDTICDGNGFTLKISLQDGEKVNADGYMKYPDGYGDFKKELEEICQPYVDQVLTENALM